MWPTLWRPCPPQIGLNFTILEYWEYAKITQNIMLLHKDFDPIVATYDILWCGNIMNVTQSGSAICFSTFFFAIDFLIAHDPKNVHDS